MGEETKYLQDELQGFIPTKQASEIIKDTARGSTILRLSKVKPMAGEREKMPMMAGKPGAYWVGEAERIKTTKAQWIFPEIIAKKLAVIVVTTKEKLKDPTINVFNEMKEAIAEAFAVKIDEACLFGTDSPFATNIMGSINKTGSKVTTTGKLDLDVSGAMGYVERAGYAPDNFVAGIDVMQTIRELRDGEGRPLYIDGTNGQKFYSRPIEYVQNGAWDAEQATIITGAWKRFSLVGIRQGIEYEVLKEATLQGTLGADGKPLSLAEQDMVALKATMRIGYLCIKDDAFAAVVPTPAG